MLSDKLLFELQLYIERHQNQSAVLLYESVPYYQGVADTELEEFVSANESLLSTAPLPVYRRERGA